MALRKRTLIPLLIALAVLVALVVAVVLRKEAPPEAARLLPESDAILYVHLQPIRALTGFSAEQAQSSALHSTALAAFVAATGIVPERDIDSAAFALHAVPVAGAPPNAQGVRPTDIYSSEVFIGRFNDQRLAAYLESIASQREQYADRTVYSIPMASGEPGASQLLRVAILGYDTVAASNMPTAEQIHSMMDRSRASALGTSGSSLLAARYHDVPLLSEAWAIGHIGLPFAQNGRINLLGMELPLPADADLIASLSYVGTAHMLAGGAVHLQVEEFAPSAAEAQHTVSALTTIVGILRGIGSAQAAAEEPGSPAKPADAVLRALLNSATLSQHGERALLNAQLSVAQLKSLLASHDGAGALAP